MSLPVYYDSDLAGLTDSLWGREAVKENERGKADPTKDAPSPLPELKLMHGALLSTSQLGRNRRVKVVTPFSPRPQQNVKFSTLTKAWACIFSACHVHTFQKISWVMLHWENVSYTTVHGVKGIDITYWASTIFWWMLRRSLKPNDWCYTATQIAHNKLVLHCFFSAKVCQMHKQLSWLTVGPK